MKWSLLFGILLTSQLVFSQQTEFRSYTTLDGLHNGTILDIVQDSLGQVWMATPDGLMRFDGYRSKTYVPLANDTTSLASRRCTRLYLDSNHALWISTANGLCRYDSNQDCFIRYNFEGYTPREQVRDRVIEIDKSIIARLDGKIFFINPGSGETYFRRISVTGPNQEEIPRYIRWIHEDQDRLYISYRIRNDNGQIFSEVYRGRRINDTLIQIRSEPELLVEGNILTFDSDSKYGYFGTDEGFYIYEFSTGRNSRKEEFNGWRINSLTLGSDGKLWLASSRNGLLSYNHTSGQIEQFTHDPNRDHTLLGNNIFSLYEDFSGMLLIGHGGEGLSTLNLDRKAFTTYRYDPQDPYSITDNTIMCFEEFDNELLVGTRNGGLHRMYFDRMERRMKFEKIPIPREFYSEVAAEAIWDIEKESESLVWLATTFGLVKAERTNGRWMFEKYLGNFTFRKLFIDDFGNIWAGSYRGLYLITAKNRDDMKAIRYRQVGRPSSGLPDNVITSFLLDSKRRFWVGTESGGVVRLLGDYDNILSKVDSSSTDLIRFGNEVITEEQIADSEINEFFEMANGNIWVATKGLGIQIYNPYEAILSYLDDTKGLVAPNVFGIVPDDLGNLWMSTNQGIARYDEINGDFRFYSPADGIQGNIFMVNSYFRDSDGYIYFGGRNGFTRFMPDMISDNSVLPKLHLKGLSIGGKELQIGDTLHNKVIMPQALHTLESIQIPYKDRNFIVHYSVIHFQYPDENKMEYYLQGFDDNPVLLQASNDRMIFTNVDKGSYSLRLRAANSDDLWTEYETILRITVLSPWYRTTVATLVFIAVVAFIVIFLVQLLLNRQSLQHELRIEKLEKSNLEELNEAKLRFFTNVSHEFRTPLSLTLGPIEALINNEKVQDVKIIRQLRLARRNARILLNLVDQIIDFRRLDAGRVKLNAGEYDISRLMASVLINFQSLVSKKEVEVFTNYPDDPLLLWYDQVKIERIFYNLISNAMKYVPRDGSLAISVSRTNNIPDHPELDGKWACISIYNDGKQIPEDSLTKVFERFYKVDNSQLGSGIGLAYSKSLVDLHHGLITAENTLDSGVTFNIYLRRGKDHLQEDEVADSSHVPSQQEILELQHSNKSDELELLSEEKDLSILVVEDNEELRDFFKSILARKFNFLEAENGKDGIEKAVEHIPDIIITDLLMPEMNGIQLIEALKSKEETSHIPVILLTAVNTPEDKVSGYEVGADAYVVKPFELKVLEAQISRLVKNRQKIQEKILSGEEAEPEEEKVISREEHFINKVNSLIDEFMEDPDLNVNGLSGKIGLSSTQLYRKVKALTGLSTVDYIKEFRLERAATLLRTTPSSVKEVCYETGFKSPSYFVKCFKKKYGVTPKEFAI